MEPGGVTLNELLAVIGDKEVQIYQLRVQIAELQAKLAAGEPKGAEHE